LPKEPRRDPGPVAALKDSLLRKRWPRIRRGPYALDRDGAGRRIVETAAGDGRAEIEHVRRRTVLVRAGAGALQVLHRAGLAAFADLERRAAGDPGEAPEVPSVAVPATHDDAGAVKHAARGVARDDAEGYRPRGRILLPAEVDRRAVIVGRDVAAPFLHAEHLALRALCARSLRGEPLDHHGELTLDDCLLQVVADGGHVVRQEHALVGQLSVAVQRADGAAADQRVEQFIAANVAAERRLERGLRGKWTVGALI